MLIIIQSDINKPQSVMGAAVLGTTVLHTDDVVLQIVYVHDMTQLSFLKKEKQSVSINLVVFLCQYRPTMPVLCSNRPL